MSAHASVLEQWLARAVEVYGDALGQRAVAERDPFRNPVGHALRTSMASLVSELFGDMDAAAVAGAFATITALRAVQGLSVDQALGFVFALRGIVRAEEPDADLAELDSRIDRLALAAFAEFLRRREQLSDLRLNERLRALGPEPAGCRPRPSLAASSGG